MAARAEVARAEARGAVDWAAAAKEVAMEAAVRVAAKEVAREVAATAEAREAATGAATAGSEEWEGPLVVTKEGATREGQTWSRGQSCPEWELGLRH